MEEEEEEKVKECSLNLEPLKSQGSLATRSAHTSSMWLSSAASVCLLKLERGNHQSHNHMYPYKLLTINHYVLIIRNIS